jgi:hypothetical protein
MKNVVRTFLFLFCVVQYCHPGRAEPTSAFDVFKGFKGAWTITSDGKKLPFELTYDLASRDSVVTEFFGRELSVFYLDRENLLMTHYCNAGSHPRLKLKQGSAAGRYEFELMDITNLKDVQEAAHVQRIIYQVVAPGELRLEIVWKRGKEEKSENYRLTKEQ